MYLAQNSALCFFYLLIGWLVNGSVAMLVPASLLGAVAHARCGMLVYRVVWCGVGVLFLFYFRR